MNWKEQLPKQFLKGDEAYAPKLEAFISRQIIEKLLAEARDKVRACPSPDSGIMGAGALKEARLINRGDALDAIDQLRDKWL
jgi:hypothetical protein